MREQAKVKHMMYWMVINSTEKEQKENRDCCEARATHSISYMKRTGREKSRRAHLRDVHL